MNNKFLNIKHLQRQRDVIPLLCITKRHRDEPSVLIPLSQKLSEITHKSIPGFNPAVFIPIPRGDSGMMSPPLKGGASRYPGIPLSAGSQYTYNVGQETSRSMCPLCLRNISPRKQPKTLATEKGSTGDQIEGAQDGKNRPLSSTRLCTIGEYHHKSQVITDSCNVSLGSNHGKVTTGLLGQYPRSTGSKWPVSSEIPPIMCCVYGENYKETYRYYHADINRIAGK